jgi:hypothetical protein
MQPVRRRFRTLSPWQWLLVIVAAMVALCGSCSLFGLGLNALGLVDTAATPTPAATTPAAASKTVSAAPLAPAPIASSLTSPSPSPSRSPRRSPSSSPTPSLKPTPAHSRAATSHAPPAKAAPTGGGSGSCTDGYYRNVDGNCVHRPTQAPKPPAGATAQCEDGTYSFSQHRQGTCSGHGGVKQWLE